MWNNDIERVLVSENEIAKAVADIGAQITKDYAGETPLLIAVLKGSVIFYADLLRAIQLPCQMEFLVAKSYGTSSASSGNVKLVKDIDVDIKNRHVIIVEDILDTALTLDTIIKFMQTREPASIKTAVLLDKQIKRKIEFTADYKAFDVENEFLVGYGLDYSERYRNLPYVGVLKRSVYE